MQNTYSVNIEKIFFRRAERWLFQDLSLRIRKGSITAIMGPSGSGKTTLLKLIGGQLHADSGRVMIDGTDIGSLNRDQLFRIRKRMALLFQNGALFTDLSVYENVAFPLRVHTTLPESMIRDLVFTKLEAVGLRGARELMPNQLSGGMARRVALARSIILDPDLIMYDEPFAGQDPILCAILRDLIKRINAATKATSIVVSHDVAETASIADYVYLIADGKIIGEGAPDELMRRSQPNVRQFFDGLPDGPVPFHYPAPDWKTDLQLEPNRC